MIRSFSAPSILSRPNSFQVAPWCCRNSRDRTRDAAIVLPPTQPGITATCTRLSRTHFPTSRAIASKLVFHLFPRCAGSFENSYLTTRNFLDSPGLAPDHTHMLPGGFPAGKYPLQGVGFIFIGIFRSIFVKKGVCQGRGGHVCPGGNTRPNFKAITHTPDLSTPLQLILPRRRRCLWAKTRRFQVNGFSLCL